LAGIASTMLTTVHKTATRLISLAIAVGLAFSAFPMRQVAAECLVKHGGGPCPSCAEYREPAAQPPTPSCCSQVKKPAEKPHGCKCSIRSADDATLSPAVSLAGPSVEFHAIIAQRPEVPVMVVTPAEQSLVATDSSPPSAPPPISSSPRAPPCLSK
jgi:hypothetical protein